MDKLIAFNDQLAGAPIGVLIFFMCIGLGYAIKSSHRIPNNIIPTCVIVLAIALFMLGAPGQDAGVPMRVWLVRNFCIGTVIGFAAWMSHKFILKRIEKKFGLFVTEDDDETTAPLSEPKNQTTPNTDPKP